MTESVIVTVQRSMLDGVDAGAAPMPKHVQKLHQSPQPTYCFLKLQFKMFINREAARANSSLLHAVIFWSVHLSLLRMFDYHPDFLFFQEANDIAIESGLTSLHSSVPFFNINFKLFCNDGSFPT